jgi:hypothetical protein
MKKGKGKMAQGSHDLGSVTREQTGPIFCKGDLAPNLWRSETLGYPLPEGEQGHATSSKDLSTRI